MVEKVSFPNFKKGLYFSILVSIDKITCVFFHLRRKGTYIFISVAQDAPEENNPYTVIKIVNNILEKNKLHISDISGIAISIIAPPRYK